MSNGLASKISTWLRRARLKSRRPVEGRRGFMAVGVGALVGGAAWWGALVRPGSVVSETGWAPLRPPGADADESVFQALCIRCGLCGTVCENGCIRAFGLDEPQWGSLTPYIDARRRSCTLCMRCTQICPTGALKPIEDREEAILGHVAMGTAVVCPDRCLSYLGRVCGVCHDACPYPRKAIRLMPPARPVVLDACVGCGRCVEECPQTPTAIEIRRV